MAAKPTAAATAVGSANSGTKSGGGMITTAGPRAAAGLRAAGGRIRRRPQPSQMVEQPGFFDYKVRWRSIHPNSSFLTHLGHRLVEVRSGGVRMKEAVDVGCGPNQTPKGHWMPGPLWNKERSEDVALTW
jgi:hypothetical protein